MPNILQHIASADSCCFIIFGVKNCYDNYFGCFTGDKLVSGINPN